MSRIASAVDIRQPGGGFQKQVTVRPTRWQARGRFSVFSICSESEAAVLSGFRHYVIKATKLRPRPRYGHHA
jgi:hypothetical protein